MWGCFAWQPHRLSDAPSNLSSITLLTVGAGLCLPPRCLHVLAYRRRRADKGIAASACTRACCSTSVRIARLLVSAVCHEEFGGICPALTRSRGDGGSRHRPCPCTLCVHWLPSETRCSRSMNAVMQFPQPWKDTNGCNDIISSEAALDVGDTIDEFGSPFRAGGWFFCGWGPFQAAAHRGIPLLLFWLVRLEL